MTNTLTEDRLTSKLGALIVMPGASSLGKQRVRLTPHFDEPEQFRVQESSSTGSFRESELYSSLFHFGLDSLQQTLRADQIVISNQGLVEFASAIGGDVFSHFGTLPELDFGEAIWWPIFEPTEAKTDAREDSPRIIQLITEIYALAEEEAFEDGVETDFSKSLTRLIRSGGNTVLSGLATVILEKSTDEEASAEALRWIGLMDDTQTHERRLWLLQKCLLSPSPKIRDGALLGISYMDDPKAVDSLKPAIEREPIETLRVALETVLEQLE